MATMVSPGVKKGGGGMLSGIGEALGILGGVALAPVTGGASLLAAAGAGAAAGGTAGRIAQAVGIDAPKQDEMRQGPTGPAIERRAQALSGPSVTSGDTSQVLKESLDALQSTPPDVQQAYAPILNAAIDQQKRKGARTPGVIS